MLSCAPRGSWTLHCASRTVDLFRSVRMMSIRNPKDFWAGVLFIALGVAAIVI